MANSTSSILSAPLRCWRYNPRPRRARERPHLPPEQVQQIGEFLEFERIVMGQFSEDGSRLEVTHIYTIPGFSTEPPVNIAAALPWFTARVREGRVLRFARLPGDPAGEAV